VQQVIFVTVGLRVYRTFVNVQKVIYPNKEAGNLENTQINLNIPLF